MVQNGDISINPFKSDKLDACRYCGFSNICPYDEKLSGFVSRSEGNSGDDEYRSIVCQRGAENDYLFK